MSKELMSEPFIFMGAIDESRDICNGNAAIAGKIDNSNDRVECCKGIRGRLRMSCRYFS